jgi:hypothetical protein
MERERKDRSASWIIERHGDSLLRLAKVSGFTSWKASSTVMSFPKQMPDGLLDVTFPNRSGPDPFLIEIETYPDQETSAQLRDDAAMVLLTRGVLPDILLIVLHPKGNLVVSPEQVLASAHGLSELRLRIHVVNLWTVPAAELLAANDVGLIPWVPLADFTGSRCCKCAKSASSSKQARTRKRICSPPLARWRKCDTIVRNYSVCWERKS